MVQTASTSAQVRARLKHPIIDTDGHVIEHAPVLLDYIREVGGADMAKRYSAAAGNRLDRPQALSAAERRDRWIPQGPWWALSVDARDRATVSTPRLLHERMDELGMDFTILYPSMGLPLVSRPEDEVRRVVCRAFNNYYADTYRAYADRMTPVAVIPMHTPQEAIDELEHAVRDLGLKAIVMASYVRRPVPKAQREYPGHPFLNQRLDTFGLDSDYDYDPVWAKCVELKVAPTFHSVLFDYGPRQSISSYTYNHVGHFAASAEAVCKSLFLGGVTRRFPTLNFAFLEGGAWWACALYADQIHRWAKRGIPAIEHLDPERMDVELATRLMAEYGDARVRAHLDDIRQGLTQPQLPPEVLDDWAHCQVRRPEDIRDLFVPRFYFGCEADDPLACWAFNAKANPLGVRLNAVLGSDIGHWDVPDVSTVIEEAYELVEHGLMGDADFEDFAFANPARLHAGVNPDFFRGTRVEQAVEKLLARPRH